MIEECSKQIFYHQNFGIGNFVIKFSCNIACNWDYEIDSQDREFYKTQTLRHLSCNINFSHYRISKEFTCLDTFLLILIQNIVMCQIWLEFVMSEACFGTGFNCYSDPHKQHFVPKNTLPPKSIKNILLTRSLWINSHVAIITNHNRTLHLSENQARWWGKKSLWVLRGGGKIW